MRYRPFGGTGAAVSDLTLSLGIDTVSRGPDAAADLIYRALEAGINSYRLENADPVLVEIAGHALSSVDRKLLNISLVLGGRDGRRDSARDFSAQGLTLAIDRSLRVSNLGWIDIAILDQPGEDELSRSSLDALKALRATGRVYCLGVAGDDPVMDVYVSTGAFDVLSTPYHVDSTWQVRSRIRMAKNRDMVVIAQDYFPEELDTARKAAKAHEPKKGFLGLSFGQSAKKDDLKRVGGFEFLHRTQNWSAEEICLAHVLSDSVISSVVIQANRTDRLELLSSIPDRDMPAGLAAQIEMARVSLASKVA